MTRVRTDIGGKTKIGLNSNDALSEDWRGQLLSQVRAHHKPLFSGQIKTSPEDFRVTEVMDIEPSGDGEHHLLKVTKVRQNTEQVAIALAKFAGVAARDVGYSGMKDFQAITTQWFSVWKPGNHTLDWSGFDFLGVTIDAATKHNRKIKRGTHRHNNFQIIIRDLQGDTGSLAEKLRQISEQGVPNYFGAQRFGRNADNMRAACDMLLNGKKIKNRNLRGILLSSARSWLFNEVVSQRVLNSSWQHLHPNEPANLDGSNSIFTAADTSDNASRLLALDIHPTAPMLGAGGDAVMKECDDLYVLENEWLSPYHELMNALTSQRSSQGRSHGLSYQRRAIRSVVHDLQSSLEQDRLAISFRLQRGQFATSVLRELLAPTGPLA